MTTFTGFSDAVLAFYDGLEADNSKAYWSDHQEIFEQQVKAPMLALLEALEPEFGPAKLFRPYRDVRFSADKSPYKTQLGAVTQSEQGAALYVAVSGEGLFAGGGYYQMSRDQLARFRQAVDDDTWGPRLQTIADELIAAGLTLSGETLLRAPRGVDPQHHRIDLLRRKGMAAGRDFGAPKWLGTKRTLSEVAAVWRRLAPMNDWLGTHVGPAQEQDERRARG